MKNLYIIGAGGFGREVAWLVRRINEQDNTWNIKGFLDDNSEKIGTFEDGYPVIDKVELLKTVSEETYAICAVGSARIRSTIINKIEAYNNPNVKFPILIDPSVISSDRNKFGEGDIICAGNIITVNAVIGKHVIVNLDCTIGHEAILGDFCTLYPSVNVSGGVTVGEGVELGTGSQIIQGINIADKVIVGAGGVVVKNLDEMGTYVGCPVRRVK